MSSNFADRCSLDLKELLFIKKIGSTRFNPENELVS